MRKLLRRLYRAIRYGTPCLTCGNEIEETNALSGVLYCPNCEVLQAALLNKIGDDLCWFKHEDKGKIPPAAEFLESCKRYHAQIASERGELAGCMTIAQLEQLLAQRTVERDEWKAKAEAFKVACDLKLDEIDRLTRQLERTEAALANCNECSKLIPELHSENKRLAGELETARAESMTTLRCHKCEGTVIYKRKGNGEVEFFHGCSAQAALEPGEQAGKP